MLIVPVWPSLRKNMQTFSATPSVFGLNCNKMHLLFLTLLTFSLCLVPINCQQGVNLSGNERSVSTSIAGMELLLETERTLLSALENYAKALEHKLIVIRNAITEMRAENLKSVNSSEQYLSNPLNSYALIRRMHSDWVHWELYLQSSVGTAEIELIQQYRLHLPTATDLAEASSAIHRLQTTYDIKPSEMAAGLLNGKQYNASLTALDCYNMGSYLFNEGNMYHASFWLYTATQRYQDSDANVVLEFDRLKILELYAEVFLKQNRFSNALVVIDAALQYSPNNAKYLRARTIIQTEIKTNKAEQSKPPSNIPSMYERCCRGDFDSQVSRLHCHYNTTTHPFLKLAPLKMEVLQLDPYMVLYHDVLSDAEIAALKALARPQLKRAMVYVAQNNRSEVINTRTSKFAWFGDNTSDVTKRINRRIKHMSGFDLNGSEMLQVMNYGLGGHYATHYDFFNVSSNSDVVRVNGDRISTVLFYMTDVDQGGATVFPNIQTAVYPRKGSAVMWYNLNNRGEGDARTLHAACPVIVGSKWVTNKWIRERAQLFSRPCYKAETHS